MPALFSTHERRCYMGASLATASLCVAFLSIVSLASAQKINAGGMRVAGTLPPDVPPVIGQPLESREPLGKGRKPAFPGQTRAVAVATKTPLRIEVVGRTG